MPHASPQTRRERDPSSRSGASLRAGTFGRAGRAALALACAAALIALAGCASTRAVQEPRTATTVPLSEAMIFPPPGGPGLLSVVETNYANAVHQDIALATSARTPGENRISITRFLAAGGDGNDGELADRELSQIDLYAETAAAWPQVQLLRSPFYVQNLYGPFGYAVGGAPTGDTCVYAWQRIEPTLRPSGSIARGAVSIRLQLCDRTQDEQTLLNVMYQMRLRDPVYAPARASILIGTPGAVILPQSPYGVANVLDLPEAQPTPTPVAPQQPSQPAAPATPAPAPQPDPVPTGPTVPLPGGGGTQVPAPVPGGPVVPLPPSGNGP